mgnify:CR=1 FL=1
MADPWATVENGGPWKLIGSNASGGIYQNVQNGTFYYDGGVKFDGPDADQSQRYQTRTDDAQGSRTGTPYATYQLDTTDNSISNVVKPPSGGGGGSTSPTNVYINQNPGELYQTVVSDGTDGYAPGTVYQVNQVTGAVTVKSRPSTTSEPASLYNDRNGDGYDDQTGLPNGVVRISGTDDPETGFTGLWFQGQKVNPDGSPFTGGSGGGEGAPKLYSGNKVWNPDTGRFETAPGYEPTNSAAASFSGSGSRIPQGSSSGGGSTAATRDYLLEQEKSDASAMARLERQLGANASENALDRALRAAESAQTAALRQQENRRVAAEGLPKALQAYDARAYFNAMKDAGYDIGNLFAGGASGGSLLTPEANSAAAILLDLARGGGGGGVATAGLQAPGAGTPGLGTPGAGVVVPPGTAEGAGAVDVTPTDPWAGVPNEMRTAQGSSGLPGSDAALDAERGAFYTQNAKANWVPTENQGSTPYMLNTVTGEKVPVSQWYSLMDEMGGANTITPDPGSIFNADEAAWAGLAPGAEGTGGLWTTRGGTGARQYFGQQIFDTASGPSYTNQETGAGVGDFKPGEFTAGYGGQLSLAGDDIQKGIDLTRTIESYPRMANGGLARAAIVGDPQRPGVPNPEVATWTPQGIHVMPMNRMAPRARSMAMAGLPRRAWGTSSTGRTSPYRSDYGWGATAPTTSTVAPTTTTAPVATAPTVPTAPAPVPAPLPTAPPAASYPASPVASTPSPSPSASAAPTAPTAVAGGSTYPVSSTGLLPQPDQGLLDEINTKRAGTDLMPGPDIYDIAFQGMSPLYQKTLSENRAQKYAIPAEELLFQAFRNRIQGASNSGLRPLRY